MKWNTGRYYPDRKPASQVGPPPKIPSGAARPTSEDKEISVDIQVSRACPLVTEGKEIHYPAPKVQPSEITSLLDLVPAILAKIERVERHASIFRSASSVAVLRTCLLNRDIISRCVANQDRTACEVLRDIALCWGVIP